MRCAHGFLAAACAALLLASGTASAVSLRPGKATDESVCDLTHDTNAFLSSKVLVPAAADQRDQVELLFRLAANFVATSCRNGQILLLQGSAGTEVDAPSLSEVANSACSVAAVERTEIKRAVGERSKPAFQLRCPITKHEQLVKVLTDRERAEPIAALKARMYSNVSREGATTSPGTSALPKEKCGQVTLASLIAGGDCK